MIQPMHPFSLLRRRIRFAGRQYRHQDDNSQSLFNPQHGFISAYDIGEVEKALDEFERTYPVNPQQEAPEDIASRLQESAAAIARNHPSKDARDLAESILTYLGTQEEREPKLPPVRLFNLVSNQDVDAPK